ncbi:MAG TPA: hypothetical protein VEB42_05585, partial [Chitinophagaceae bacterium]|nr:hypothetical protein [Chitinophagaceae bacterium]
MVQTLSRYSKPIAWSLATVFFMELFLVPLSAKSEYSGSDWKQFYRQINLPRQLNAVPRLNAATAPQVQNAAQPVKLSGKAFTSAKRSFGGGPTQPEMQAFSSV